MKSLNSSTICFLVLLVVFTKTAYGSGQIAYFTGGINSGSGTGHSISGGFDINKDNRTDIIIGLPNIANVSLFYNMSKSNVSDFSIHSPSGNSSSKFGWQTVVGDCNGDNWLDLFVSAYAEARVYGFYGSADGYGTIPNVTLVGPTGSSFGFSLAVGDANNDSYIDVLVGAITYSNPELNEGAAFLYLGSESGLNTTYHWMKEGAVAGNQFGYSMDFVDIQGDAYDDIVIGAPFSDKPLYVNSGAAYLYLGSANGPSDFNTTLAPATNFSAQFGYSISNVRDINADGYDDFAVGAWGESYPIGAVYVYAGGPSAPTLMTKIFGSIFPYGNGYSFAGSGSLDADPYGDIILGGQGYAQGSFCIVRGSADGIIIGSAYYFYSISSVTFGDYVVSPGDVDGDGFPDFLAGDSSQEMVYLFYSNGASILLPASPSTSPSRTPSVTPSNSPSASVTRTPSVTPSPSRTPSISRSPSKSPSVTPSPSKTPSSSASTSPSVTPSNSPSRTPSASVSPSRSSTPSRTATPSGSPTASITPSETPSSSVTPTQSPSSSATPTSVPSTSVTPTPSVTPSTSPSSSAAATTSPTPEAERGNGGGSSSGPLIGGIVGGVAGLALCGAVAAFAIRKRRKSQEIEDVIPME